MTEGRTMRMGKINNNNTDKNDKDSDNENDRRKNNENEKKSITTTQTKTTSMTKNTTKKTLSYPVSASSPGQASLTTPQTASCTAESRKASPPCKVHV